MNEVKENSLLLLPIKDLNGLKFKIGGYQRGYKWGKKEILELLNDINEYDQNSGVYCIQPLIIKPLCSDIESINIDDREEKINISNEIIDGQQRTTTIYLLLQYLSWIGEHVENVKYSIDYQIRPKSGNFLSTSLEVLFKYLPNSSEECFENVNYNDLTEAHSCWDKYLQSNPNDNNVDIYHFFIVSYYIKLWFNKVMKDDKALFIQKLLNHVHVIWYSLEENSSEQKVIETFLNNNKGKITLTTSELIKALFILDITNIESKAVSEFKINRFALEWDSIEKRLQDDTFWYFIQPDSTQYNQGTRIDYLFDLHISSKENISIETDDKFAYRYYEKKFNQQVEPYSKDFEEEWLRVLQLFNKLVDWYNDKDFYHLVGFLTVSKIQTLKSILESSEKRTKTKFKGDLRGEIKATFDKSVTRDKNKIKPYFIDNLHYKNFPKQTQHVLLLYNVLYYMNTMSENKFPFELYVKQKWSIEHIIAQNPKEIENFGEYKFWFKEQLQFQNLDDTYKDIIKELEEVESFPLLEKKTELHNSMLRIIESFEDKTHEISNLLLLDRNTNSALGNLSYEHKRKKIIQIDKNGTISSDNNDLDEKSKAFIPHETLNAFNKTFSDEIDYKYWTSNDGELYKKAVSERLNDFLPTKD